jgi:hypothetical protein
MRFCVGLDSQPCGWRYKMNEEKLTELPYERIAMAGGEMPDGLKWYDQQMFLNLRLLYFQYIKGIIDRSTATTEKAKLLREWESQKWLDGQTWDIAKKIAKTEKARQEYRKNRTLENADEIIFAFEGVPVSVNGETL